MRLSCLTSIAALLALAGCSGGPARVSVPSVDPSAVSAKALELYDANADAAIDADEAAKCPPLKGALATFDVDKDGKIGGEELTAHLEAVTGSGSALTGMTCVVNLSGRPLAGAVVKLRPAEMYGDALLPAQGTADESGVARVSIGDENLPEKMAGALLVYPGLYHVEITHPTSQLPAKYNTATELGCEVNPTSREGTSARFDL